MIGLTLAALVFVVSVAAIIITVLVYRVKRKRQMGEQRCYRMEAVNPVTESLEGKLKEGRSAPLGSTEENEKDETGEIEEKDRDDVALTQCLQGENREEERESERKE